MTAEGSFFNYYYSTCLPLLLNLTTFEIIKAREIIVSPSCYFTTFEIITGRAKYPVSPPITTTGFVAISLLLEVKYVIIQNYDIL